MDKKVYIIPVMNSRHLILGGAIAQIPTYGDTGGSVGGDGALTKERREEEFAASAEGWDEKGLW